MRQRIGVISLLALSTGLLSAAEWTLSGQIRHRFEWDHRAFNADQGANTYHLLRSRLGVQFSADPVYAYFQFQDSRTFGTETSTLTDGSADHFDLHQGYLRIRHPFGWRMCLKIGRQEVALGNQRLMGAVGWHNIGRSFDGLLLKSHLGPMGLRLFTLRTNETSAPKDQGDFDLFGLYGTLPVSGLKVEPLLLLEKNYNLPDSQAIQRFTAYAWLHGGLGPLSYSLEGAYQGGTQQGLDIAAFLAAAKLGYTLQNTPAQPGLALGLDFLSGDSDPTDDKLEVFNTLYATNHKFYGYMDYFLNLPVHTYGLGLQDLYATLSLRPYPGLMAKATAHLFQAAQDYTLQDGSKTRTFGNEVDLTLAYRYGENLGVSGGFSVFLPGDIFKEQRGEDPATWFYLMTTVTFK